MVRHIVASDRIERPLAHMALRPVITSIRMYVAVNSRGDLEDIESRQLRHSSCFSVGPTEERGGERDRRMMDRCTLTGVAREAAAL